MSGGYYDYFYSKMKEVADQIDPIEIKEERVVVKLMRDFAELMYELEWWKSGDTGKDRFIKLFRRFEKKWLKRQK